MNEFEFNLKTKAKFGPEQALLLGECLKELSFNRIAVIVDSGVHSLEYVKKILGNVEKENFNFVKVWEYNLSAEPDYQSLDRVKQEFLDKNSESTVDCFVAIGGGSIIDFAKGLATLVQNSGPAINYRGFPKDINMSLPVIAIPTTAGTASEVTYNAVFIDTTEKKKLGINTFNNFPVLAILDPNLIVSCPKKVMVSTGMDALTHALESYVATKANPLTRFFSKESFSLVFNNLPRAISDKDNETLANLQRGAYLAGIALMNSGSGIAGALSYILGTHYKVPHGIAGAIFLPHVVDYNIVHGYDYSQLYDSIDGVDKSISVQEKNKRFSKIFFDFCGDIGVPKSLKEFGVNEENTDVLLSQIETLEKAFAQNSTPFSVEDGKKLLKNLIN